MHKNKKNNSNSTPLNSSAINNSSIQSGLVEQTIEPTKLLKSISPSELPKPSAFANITIPRKWLEAWIRTTGSLDVKPLLVLSALLMRCEGRLDCQPRIKSLTVAFSPVELMIFLQITLFMGEEELEQAIETLKIRGLIIEFRFFCHYEGCLLVRFHWRNIQRLNKGDRLHKPRPAKSTQGPGVTVSTLTRAPEPAPPFGKGTWRN